MKFVITAVLFIVALSFTKPAGANEGVRVVNELGEPATVTAFNGNTTLSTITFGKSVGESKELPAGTNQIQARATLRIPGDERGPERNAFCQLRNPPGLPAFLPGFTVALQRTGSTYTACKFEVIDYGEETTVVNQTPYHGKVDTFNRYGPVRKGIAFPAGGTLTIPPGITRVHATIDMEQECRNSPGGPCDRYCTAVANLDKNSRTRRWVIRKASLHYGCEFAGG